MTLEELLELLDAARQSKRDIVNTAKTVKKTAKKTKRKLSKWQRYIKNRANHIKFKRGTNKGKLDLKAMSRAFKRSNK